MTIESLILLNCTYHKATVIKIVWYTAKDRYVDQISEIEKYRNKLLHI